MKRCGQCKKWLPLTQFSSASSKAQGVQDRCRACKKIYNAAYYQQTKERHNPSRRATRIAAREQRQAFIWSILTEARCADCGSTDARVFEFDHRPGEKKMGDVARMAQTGRPVTMIKKEIEKCDIVCANCHRIRTYERSGSYRTRAPLAQR